MGTCQGLGPAEKTVGRCSPSVSISGMNMCCERLWMATCSAAYCAACQAQAIGCNDGWHFHWNNDDQHKKPGIKMDEMDDGMVLCSSKDENDQFDQPHDSWGIFRQLQMKLVLSSKWWVLSDLSCTSLGYSVMIASQEKEYTKISSNASLQSHADSSMRLTFSPCWRSNVKVPGNNRALSVDLHTWRNDSSKMGDTNGRDVRCV